VLAETYYANGLPSESIMRLTAAEVAFVELAVSLSSMDCRLQ